MKHRIFILILIISLGLNVVLIHQQNVQKSQQIPNFTPYIKVLHHVKGNLGVINDGTKDNKEELVFATKGMLKTLLLLSPEVTNTPEASKYHMGIFDLYSAGEYRELERQVSELLEILKPALNGTNDGMNKDLVEKLNAFYKSKITM